MIGLRILFVLQTASSCYWSWTSITEYHVSVKRWRKFRASWLFFLFVIADELYSFWLYDQRNVFIGYLILGKRDNFKKHVPGTLSMMWRKRAELRNSIEQVGICESVGDFTGWGDEEEKATGSNSLITYLWLVFLLEKECWCFLVRSFTVINE